MQSIRVEFFGIPRSRAQVPHVDVSVHGESVRLGELFEQLAEQFPQLAAACFEGTTLRSTFAANIDGQAFVSDPHYALRAGQSLLLMSADAGG